MTPLQMCDKASAALDQSLALGPDYQRGWSKGYDKGFEAGRKAAQQERPRFIQAGVDLLQLRVADKPACPDCDGDYCTMNCS